MAENSEISSKLSVIRESLNQNLSEFARNLDIPRSTLVSYENGTTVPAELLSRIVSKFGVSEEWFLSDMGPVFKSKEQETLLIGEKNNQEKAMFLASPPLPDTPSGGTPEKGRRGIPLVFESDKEFEDGIVIPVLGDNPVSAGHGEGVGDGELPTRYIHAPRELAKYPHLMSLPVRGDSMAPTLSDGDMVVCDGGGWDGDGIYVIKTTDETFVKRVQHTPQGYRVVSDNKLYESYTGSAEDVAIVGRVRAMVVMVPGRR
jgi:phage repressor protein C with HTH and peptisase S24 domain